MSASTSPALTPTKYAPSIPSGPGSLAARARITIAIDTDMLMAAEDQAKSMGVPFQEWCQQAVNDALRSYLGV